MLIVFHKDYYYQKQCRPIQIFIEMASMLVSEIESFSFYVWFFKILTMALNT